MAAPHVALPRGTAATETGSRPAQRTRAADGYRRRPIGSPPWKVLWASPCWMRGGLETVTLTHLEHMRPDLWRHEVIAARADGMLESVPESVPTHLDYTIHEWSFPPTVQQTRSATDRCSRWLETIIPDVVVSSLLPSMTVAALRAGVPAVVEYLHCGWSWDLLNRPADTAVAVSTWVEQQVAPARPGVPIRLIPNGVSGGFRALGPAMRAAARTALGIAQDRRVVGFVGRLCEEKRPLEWLEALAIIRRSDPTAHGLMVGGDYGWGGQVGERMVELGLEPGRDVTFYEATYDLMPGLYSAMDVLLHTRHNEPFGMVLVEAMLCGVPAVGYAGGGMPDIAKLAPRLRLVGAIGDAGALADAALDAGPLLTGAEIDLVRREFGAAAMSGRFESLLLQLIEQRGGSPCPTDAR